MRSLSFHSVRRKDLIGFVESYNIWAVLFCVFSATTFFMILLRSSGVRKGIVNVESCIGLVFILSLGIRVRKSSPQNLGTSSFKCSVWFYTLLVGLPFLTTVRAPLLYDSYAHVVRASQETWQQLIAGFYVHPNTGDFFFRPLGYVGYWMEAKWADFSFWIWHANGIVLHILATLLLYGYARRLNLSSLSALSVALLFGLHASNAEVVFWTAARFDEYCTCFTLASLLLLCKHVDSHRPVIWMFVAAVAAMLCKEAAFCLPALAFCTILYRGSRFHKKVWKVIAGLIILEITILGYRAWVVQGLGGYGAESGDPMLLHFSFLHLLQLLVFRMWSVLFFPINWSVDLQFWAVAGVFVGVGGLSIALALVRVPRRQFIASVAFCWFALLPASPLGLLDGTMLGARVYHLAVIGFAILFGAIIEGAANNRMKLLLAAAILTFQGSALCHNLLIWRGAAELAGRVCREFPRMIAPNQPVLVDNLPQTLNGVFFLGNGFPACVYVNSGTAITFLSTAPSGRTPTGNLQQFTWSKASNQLMQPKIVTK